MHIAKMCSDSETLLLSLFFSLGVAQNIWLEAPKATIEDEYKNNSIYEIRIVEGDTAVINYSSPFSPVTFSVADSSLAQVINTTQKTVLIKGKFLGRTKLIINLADDLIDENYTIAVLRPSPEAQIAFGVVVGLLSATTTFMMGTQIDWRIIVKTMKKPIAPTIGFACQFIIMPLVALGWGRVLLPGQEFLQLGYFAVGCCPGGKMSNLWCILLDANLDLSITLTACSTVLALVMMPAWLLTIGPNVISQNTDIHIPYPNMLGSLALIVAPTLAGMYLKHRRPKAADWIASKIKIVSLFTMIIVVTAASIINYYIFLLFTWRAVLAGMLLPWTGFALSWFASWALRQNQRDIRTIAIETGIQNCSIAIIIITFSLPQPDADMTMVMPVVCMLFTPIPLAIGGGIVLAYRRWKGKKAASLEEKPAPITTVHYQNGAGHFNSAPSNQYDNKAFEAEMNSSTKDPINATLQPPMGAGAPNEKVSEPTPQQLAAQAVLEVT